MSVTTKNKTPAKPVLGRPKTPKGQLTPRLLAVLVHVDKWPTGVNFPTGALVGAKGLEVHSSSRAVALLKQLCEMGYVKKYAHGRYKRTAKALPKK